MTKKINAAQLGLFIVVSLGMGVAGLMLFSSSKWFTKSYEFIAYFDDSLNGLNEGAPVKYRGVTIGSVKRVMVNFNQATNDSAMPVILEIQENLITARLGSGSEETIARTMNGEFHRDLRATLEAESLVTGVLYVNLDRKRNPPHAVYHQLEEIYPEILTQPTEIQALLGRLAQLDVKGLIDRLNSVLTQLEVKFNAFQIQEINDGLTNLLGSINRLMDSPALTNTLASAQTTLDEFRRLATKIESRVDPLTEGATNTLAQATQALGQLRGAGESIRDMLAPDSPLRHDLAFALDQLGGAAQAIAALSEFLKQHPNALLTGRQKPDKLP